MDGIGNVLGVVHLGGYGATVVVVKSALKVVALHNGTNGKADFIRGYCTISRDCNGNFRVLIVVCLRGADGYGGSVRLTHIVNALAGLHCPEEEALDYTVDVDRWCRDLWKYGTNQLATGEHIRLVEVVV